VLQQLTVHNYTLVEQLQLDFREGMTAISGETGAGKSILLDALGLVLGNRSESGNVRSSASCADIHAVFELARLPVVKEYLAREHLNNDEDNNTCILRRVINTDGRSRGYINGRPVNMGSLRQLGRQLVNIHGQHEHQHLLSRDSHQQLLDAYGNYQTILQEVMQLSDRWQQLEQQAHKLQQGEALSIAEQQLLRYQIDELQQLALEPGELTQLEQEHKQRANADQLIQAVYSALAVDQDNAVDPRQQLQHWIQALDPFVNHSPKLSAAVDMINSACIQIEESQHELQQFIDSFEQDSQRLHWLEQRLDQIYTIARKHRLAPELLLKQLVSLQAQVQDNRHRQEKIEQIRMQQQNITEAYNKVATELSRQRKQTACRLQQAVREQLCQLDMSQCKLELSLSQQHNNRLPPQGWDNVEILISTNPGQPPQPLTKIASGGELSRISLAIQVVIAQTSVNPTLIFDEVDVGIGGATAEIVGRLLAKLSHSCQLLCITHLPQVASQARQHLQVCKTSQGKMTRTHIKYLSHDQRIMEIARMLGGITLTEQTIAHAREMVGLDCRLHS